MRHRLHPAFATLMVGSLCLSACMSYTQIDPADVADYKTIRVTTNSGRQEKLWDPRTAADTLIGTRASGDTLRLTLAWVQEISEVDLDEVRTAAFLGGVIVVVGAVAFTVVAIGMSSYCGAFC